MKPASLCALLLTLVPAAAPAAENGVRLEKKADGVHVAIDGEPFTLYNFSEELPKPFFHPVRGPGGPVLTRPIERKGDDHPHHKGLWVAVDKVNGVAFWAEEGTIRNVSTKPLVAEGAPAKLQVVNHWLNEQGEAVLKEKTVVSIYPNRLIAYEITLSPAGEAVTFGDTKEGFLGFRMVNSMREKEGGHVVNAEGLKGAGPCWGKRSDWVDYYGPVEGETFGVAIFDHPGNFRPSRYHVRNYGLFSISPFGEKAYAGNDPAPVTLEGEESLRLRYGVYIHAGDTDAADVPRVYRRWVESAK